MAEVCFADDGVYAGRFRPGVVRGVGLADGQDGTCREITFLQPIQVGNRVVDHFGVEVRSANGKTANKRFLENRAGATEGVEDTKRVAGCVLSTKISRGRNCQIEHDLGEFWREHADKCVAFGLAAVAASVGGDVLNATALGDDDASVVSLEDD